MALVVFLYKPPEHGSIVRIRFQAAILVEEKKMISYLYLKNKNMKVAFFGNTFDFNVT